MSADKTVLEMVEDIENKTTIPNEDIDSSVIVETDNESKASVSIDEGSRGGVINGYMTQLESKNKIAKNMTKEEKAAKAADIKREKAGRPKKQLKKEIQEDYITLCEERGIEPKSGWKYLRKAELMELLAETMNEGFGTFKDETITEEVEASNEPVLQQQFIMTPEIGANSLFMLNVQLAKLTEALSKGPLNKTDYHLDGYGQAITEDGKQNLELYKAIYLKYGAQLAPMLDPLVLVAMLNVGALQKTLKKKTADGNASTE